MKEGKGLRRLVFLSVAMAVVVGWAGTVWAQTPDSRVKPKIDPATGEEIWFEDEVIEPCDQPFNPYLLKGSSALDRAFGYVWEGNLESRLYNLPHGGSLGISSEYYRHGIQGAARERDRFNVIHALALGVDAGPWFGSAQVHENTGYFIGTGGSSYVGDAEWEATDGSRGTLFADPPQTRFDVPLLAIRSLQATWPVIDGTPTWPAPEDVEEVWAGTDTWLKWARKEGDEFYGEFDDNYATRRGTGEQSVLNVSGRFRVLQYGTNDATYYQYELTNNSSYTYTDVYVGHFQRRRLTVDDGNESFPRWDGARQFTYQVGTEYFARGDGTHTDDDGDPAPWGGWLYLESPTGSQRTDALGDTLTPGPSTVLTRVALVEYGQRVRGGDHEWGQYAAMSGDVDLFEDPTSGNDVWKHITQGGGAPILMQDEYVWTKHVYPGATAPNDSLTEINYTCFHYFSSGPILLWAPGEKIVFDMALVAAPDEQTLLANADKAIRTYQARLESSGPPPAPALEVSGTAAGPAGRQLTMLHAYPIQYVSPGSITLTWDGAAAETALDAITLANDFQGYRVYKSIDRGSSWGDEITDENANRVAFRPVAQFDIDDAIEGQDPATYMSLGSNTGLQHTWTDTDVMDGFEYWYAITTYDHDPAQDPTYASFESAIGANPNAANVVAVIATSRPNGYRAGMIGTGLTAGAEYFLYLPTDTEREVSIFAVVIDDALITGDEYAVSVVGDSSWYGSDLYPLEPGILLRNTTTSVDFFDKPVLGSKMDLGFDNVPVTDGFRIVTMPPIDADGVVVEDGGVYEFEITTDMSDSTNYTVSLEEAYMQSDGSAANRANRTGLMNVVEFRFTGWVTAAGDTNWIFTRSGGGYSNGDLIQCPFELWDVETNTRLMPGTYWPGQPFWDGYYFMVTPVPYYEADGVTVKPFTDTHPSSDSEYWGYDTSNPNSRSDWAYRLGFNESSFSTNEDYWDVGDVWTMTPYKTLVGLGGQSFTFGTTAAAIEDTLIDYDNIMVVPNPYYIRAEWDMNENNRKVQFTNIPPNSTIDIYNIAGELITSLDHGETYNSTQIGSVEWNMWTYEYTEVAFGLYIYVVKVGDSVKKVGKFAVIR